jgi:hypothetical protein
LPLSKTTREGSEIDGGYAREPFPTLGKASLQVSWAHVFFVFAAVAVRYGDIPELRGFEITGCRR